MSTANISAWETSQTPTASSNLGVHSSGVSWAAVGAGAFVCAALSLVLLSLGSGLGLSAISPWSAAGATGSTFGASAILWLIINEIVSSAMGGYLAGRLRTSWVSIHNDEVYFRDTAHGLLVWAVAVVITVSFMAAAASSMVGDVNPTSPHSAGANTYFVDRLFRSDQPHSAPGDAAVRAEASRIFAYSLTQGKLDASDMTYLNQLVAAQTGMNPSAAQQRVSSVLADAKQASESSRKAVSHLLLWLFVALLMGAFSASFASTIGGRQRDHVKTI